MTILEIKKYPNSILRKKCKEAKEITKEIKALARNMVETMTESEGIGLAAPQVGELKRVIVVHPIRNRSLKARDETNPQAFINPKIIRKSKEAEIDEEGCLSFPGLFLKIKRAKKVVIEALNQEGKKIQIKAEGLPARVFQHEIDHLDGILFIDKIPFRQRLKIRKKLKEIAKQYVFNRLFN